MGASVAAGAVSVGEGTGVVGDVDLLVARLYEAESARLVQMARWFVDDATAAEDLVQEAFIRLTRHGHRIREPERAAAYLRSIVINLARDHNRRGLVSLRHRPPADPDPRSAEDHATMREDVQEVVAALRGLPRRQRDCVVLRYYLDLPVDEIAETLGVSRNSVKTHLTRGLKNLSTELEERDEPARGPAAGVTHLRHERHTVAGPVRPGARQHLRRPRAQTSPPARDRPRHGAAGRGGGRRPGPDPLRERTTVMPWWTLELLTTGLLAFIALWLGPFIKRFGRAYAADVFHDNPLTGKSYIVLTDIVYYLIFGAYILFTVNFEPAYDWGPRSRRTSSRSRPRGWAASCW